MSREEEIRNKAIETNLCSQCVYAVDNHCGLRGFTNEFNRNYCSAQNTDKLPNGFELQSDGYFSWVNKGPKEIHFHKDGIDFPIEEFDYYDYYHVNYNSTMKAIKNGDELIITTALSAFDFHSLLDRGYKIFLHENGKVGEVYEGVTELTDKELRKGHDIRKIWIGGGFEDYFYK